MAQKLRPYTVRLDMDTETFIEKEATYNRRSVATQILFIIDEYRRKKLNEMEFFRPSQLDAAEEKTQFFRTPSELPEDRLSKLKEKLGRDNT